MALNIKCCYAECRDFFIVMLSVITHYSQCRGATYPKG
jgi:hypothetical protein